MKRKYFLASLAILITTVFTAHLYESSRASGETQLLTALQEGGHVIYFRHAEKSNTPNLPARLPKQFGSCLFPETLLTEAGVSSMRSLGQQFEQLNIPIDQVLSSPACRCVESAWFSFEEVTTDAALNGVYQKDSEGNFIINPDVTETLAFNLRHFLIDKPDSGSNTILFAHSSNILALTGLELEEGEAAIFKPDNQGHFVFVGRMNLDQWQRVASP